MRNIYYLIKKNLKLLVRTKSSALIVIFAPLIIILLLGLSYNTSQTGLNIGVQASAFTPEIDSFLNSLQEEDYKIIKYEKTEECVEDIKTGFVHTCLVLPENFQVQDNSPKEILFYIDQTKINLVYLITDTLNKRFNLKSKEVSQELASGILTKLFNTKTKIEEKSSQVEEAKTKNQQALGQSKTIRSELVSLDLATPTNIYNASMVEGFKEGTHTKILAIQDSLTEAKAKVTASQLNSSDKAAINNRIAEANTELNNIENSLNGTGEGTLGEIAAMIASLQMDLDSTKTKLNAASQTVSSAGTQLSSLSTTLDEGIVGLEAIKTTLTEIQQDIASQKVTDPSTISSPLVTKIEKITVEKTNLSYLFPSLMVLVVMFISLLLGTTLVMMEKHNQAYFRNFIIPVRKITFVFSTYLTNCFLVLLQIGIILGISLIFLKEVAPQLSFTALILFVSSSVFTLMGMMVGYLFSSEDTGTLASISSGALFLFVSGVILPLESMSPLVREITYFNPFVISEKMIREIFIFKTPFTLLLNDLFLLVGYGVLLFILILVIDAIASKHFLTKALYKHHKYLREKKTRKFHKII